MKKILVLPVLLLLGFTGFTQNLPSLFSERNINSTFSIVAYDSIAQEWGIAVATDNIYVGNSTIYIKPGVGAFSVIAETEPMYGLNGLAQLEAGSTIQDAILFSKNQDSQNHYRQVSGINAQGEGYAFTGDALANWKGVSTHFLGDQFVVMGNQLEPKVLERMAQTFQDSRGPLAKRLLKSLLAGQAAGGQVSGKQSAALVVKGSNNEWYNQVDLRVDHSKTPFQDLQQLLNYHYGRIRLNQTLFALKAENTPRATKLLNEAVPLIEGWTGMYSKLALIYSLMGDDDQAAATINKALIENPSWKANLPAFYYLREHPSLQYLIDPSQFDIQDWEHAINMLVQLGRGEDAIQLAVKQINQGNRSSNLYYILAQGYHKSGRDDQAINSLQKALNLDSDHIEAQYFLNSLK